MNLNAIELKAGMHTNRDKGVCLNEAVAWYAGEPHSDSPACMSKWLAIRTAFINDHTCNRAQRQILKDLIPRLATTAGEDPQLLTAWLRCGKPGWNPGTLSAVLSGVTGDVALSGANLAHAPLSCIDLSGVNLSHTNFYNADLSCAILTGASMHHAIMEKADLTGVDPAVFEGMATVVGNPRIFGKPILRWPPWPAVTNSSPENASSGPR